MAQPVFYDPRQARWKRLRRLFDLLGISVMLLVIFFIYNALQGEHLPELFWATQKKPYHALKENEKEKAKEKRRKLAAHRGYRNPSRNPSLALNSEEGIRAGFYVPWDAASFSSLREYGRQIDLLYPEWLHVLTPDGHLQGIDETDQCLFDVIQGANVRPVDDKVMPFVKSEDTGMEVFPMVNNSDGRGWVDISVVPERPRRSGSLPATDSGVPCQR